VEERIALVNRMVETMPEPVVQLQTNAGIYLNELRRTEFEMTRRRWRSGEDDR